MSEDQRESNMVQIGALWQRKSQKGLVYWSGTMDAKMRKDLESLPMGSIRIMMFENDSDNPSAPIFRLTAAPYEEQQGGQGIYRGYKNRSSSPKPQGDDDMPF